MTEKVKDRLKKIEQLILFETDEDSLTRFSTFRDANFFRRCC